MTTCNQITDHGMVKGAFHNDESRVNYFSLTHCQIENYIAPTYSIKYVVQGTEHYWVDKKKISVGQGKFLVVNGSQPIDVAYQSKKPVVGFCIHLQPSLLADVHRTFFQKEEMLLDEPETITGVPEFEALLYSENENRLGSYLQIMARLFERETVTIAMAAGELYQILCRELLQMQCGSASQNSLAVLKSSTRKELLSRLAIARELLTSNIMEESGIEDVAREAMLSPAHFYRTFKKVYGISPHQYKLEQKIAKAAVLLRSKKGSITEVALSCGFPDLSSFSKQFKKTYQLSPAQFVKAVS